ncbi:peptide chain release factor N(5)-glutamine methyltransferase [uncultured Tyzzerella sp.]|uniref:peptide chain release factor N(5)-glutamine methyltransferase n=1 Tax=uncultured Tyzzerella sp. TaxID=2321398 RepID=UPI002943195E|nr:peptide chain release factor N(5)-glutamine methyltransferase [uncultured Tyzzerella sp.]
MSKKIKDMLIEYKKILKDNNFDTYYLDVEVLLMAVTNFNKTQLYLNSDYVLKEEEIKKFENFFNRRLKNEPIAYIIGKCEFMGMDFLLNNHTLIPRPDTEILVEKTIEIIKEYKFKTVLDIGTGSGAIAISLANYCNINIDALDVNDKALDMAKKNAKLNNVKNINFIQSNIFENVTNKYDIIVSNPPYIKTEIIKTLETNVKDYEPMLALDGGNSGLIFYEKITNNAFKYLNKNGYLLFEIGHDQAEEVKQIMEINNFCNITVLKDLSGLDRVVFGKIN